MTTRNFYFFLVSLALLLWGSAQACQPPQLNSYTHDLDDGEHVFVMKAHHRAEFDYPVSGLYRKGAEKELVWAYDDDWYIPQEEIQNQISRDGRYLVYIAIPTGDKHPSLLIYEHGNLAHQLYSKHFLDHPDQKRERICGLPFWGFGGQYDKLNDVFSVETTGKRRVSIHVPTGDVIQTEQIMRMRIDAVITLKDETQVVVRAIGHCDYDNSSGMMIVFRKEAELIDSPLIWAHETGHYADVIGKSYYFPDSFRFFLDEIESMIFSEADENDYYPVKVVLKDGSIKNWFASKTFNICGSGENGEIVNVKAKDFRTYNTIFVQPEFYQ